ncbi:MAG: hypothetical protein OXU96_09555 [Gammaproteobacteria bacterium]|nr:hypothetical protein [Gammaproteobacteria bacterium]
MKNLRENLGFVTWSLNSTLETINRLGIAMVIAGWLQSLVSGAPVNWSIFTVGLVFIFISFVRHPKWTTSP